jgi:hypothetical protein
MECLASISQNHVKKKRKMEKLLQTRGDWKKRQLNATRDPGLDLGTEGGQCKQW